MSWRLCDAGIRLRDEVNALFPNRDKRSDGALGDAAHAARESDHNPDKNGIVRAIDVDEDVWGTDGADPVMANRLVRQIVDVARTDGRIKYVIFEGKIWSPMLKWKGRVYSGGNPHNHHIHISFNESGDNDGSPFGLVDSLKDEVAVERPKQVRGKK